MSGVVRDCASARVMGDDFSATLPGLVAHHRAERPEAPAFTFEGRTLSYREVDDLSSAIADALHGEGFGLESRIAYIGRNTLEFALLLLGTAKCGAVVAPLNPRLAKAELAMILEDSGATGLLVSEEFAAYAAEFSNDRIKRTWLCGSDNPNSFLAWATKPHPKSRHVAACGQTVLMQLYTSGTTGQPKGVLLTQDSLIHQRLASAQGNAWWDCQEPGDTMLLALTISHVGGLQVLMRGLFAGGHIIILRDFVAAEVLEAIGRYGAARLIAVPTTLQLLLDHPLAASMDFSRLRIVQYGAAPIPLDLLRRALKVLGCQFVQVYGMTELGGSITALPPSDHDPDGNARMASVGIPLPGVEIRIVREDGRTTAEPMEIGEIWVKSRAVMRGYWRRPEETRAALDEEGWYRTGDAGYADEQGYIFLRDRIKDVICSGAENIYPAEVENALLEHPAVAEVAVIGIPDDRWGEAVKAVVVLRDGHQGTETELIDFARERIARFKTPKTVDFVASLPRNALGKVQRRALRNQYARPVSSG